MDEIADITAIPSLISDVVTPSDHPTTSFSTTWDSNDALSFQPANLPLRRIQRAWERQPKSPHTRKGHVRKVWKRYELPSRASVIATGGDAISNVSALHKLKSEAGRRSSLETPSKITKKMCLGTAFGQKAKAQEWERRRTSPRRTDQLSEEVRDGEVSAEEWSDIASDEELETSQIQEISSSVRHQETNALPLEASWHPIGSCNAKEASPSALSAHLTAKLAKTLPALMI
ncbi:hypothetical protein LTR28_004686 [Elasticomyces elasticus]|nr:hypothetical protein LTR28_004686 [Elasticomyces elasticus]